MNEHLSSTPSTDHDKPSIPAAYRIYGEERPDFEEGAGAMFWAFLAGVGLAAIVIAFLPF